MLLILQHYFKDLTLKNGNISYTTKFLQSNTFKKNEKANEITVSEFGTPGPANKSPFSRFKNVFDFETLVSDNAISNIIKLGSHFFAVGDCPYYLEVDPVSLDVINRINLNKIFNLVTQNVHVHEEEDGDIEKGKIVTSIPTRWKLNPCYIHSIVLTKNYIIFIEPPLAVSIMELMANTLKNTPFIEGLHWKNEKTLFHIISRSSWKEVSTKYVSDPFFFIHFSNAFEKGRSYYSRCEYLQGRFIVNEFIYHQTQAKSNSSASFHEGFCPILKRFIIPLKVESMKENEELVQLQNAQCSAKKTGNEVSLSKY
ncbi:Carotenoid isomerooxygenase [Armadillidium nasatum]|uniref:Carotenoid isomerooxygenase n=1 Tax=Armadillidium nasatum TaxID=96803 RepID=A0A5N5T4U2_9CRUS|nr:Carotenoid isomerooxygenase [Armadillidium nasatum]